MNKRKRGYEWWLAMTLLAIIFVALPVVVALTMIYDGQ